MEQKKLTAQVKLMESLSPEEKKILFSIYEFILKNQPDMISFSLPAAEEKFKNGDVLSSISHLRQVAFYKAEGEVGSVFEKIQTQGDVIMIHLTPGIFFSESPLNFCLNHCDLKSEQSRKILETLYAQNGELKMTPQEVKDLLELNTSGKWKMFIYRLDRLKDALERSGIFDNVCTEITRRRGKGNPIESVLFSGEKITGADLFKAHKAEAPALSVVKIPFSFTNEMPRTKDGLRIECTLTNVPCPRCEGNLIEMTNKWGGKYCCCTNSAYWGLGTQDCSFKKDGEVE